ncbi:MAG TPA: M15 family metallopeptidase [Longimicrobium sp.]
MSSERRAALVAACAALLAACSAGAASPALAPDAQRCSVSGADRMENVQRVDSTIRVDVRYATRNNFTGERLPGYDRPLALLRPEVARALGRVQARLRAEGLGLKVFDGYRPVRATLAMVDWAERTNRRWVLDQGYVARESGHNRGHTVDLTLVRLDTGEELDMGTAYDTFSEAAHTANATGAVRANRDRLVAAMKAEGFENYANEWWHFRRPGENFSPLDVPLGCFR